MGTPAFDTYKTIRKLTEAGADEPLAAAMVDAIGDAITGELATKADLKELRAELKAEINELRAEMKAEINGLKQYMIIRLGGMFIAAVGIMIAAVALLLQEVMR